MVWLFLAKFLDLYASLYGRPFHNKMLIVGMVENPWKPEKTKDSWHFWVYIAGTPLEAEEFICEFKIRGHKYDEKLNQFNSFKHV
jgi:hypothetical protein